METDTAAAGVCVCGDGQDQHRLRRRGCKQPDCGCDRFEPAEPAPPAAAPLIRPAVPPPAPAPAVRRTPRLAAQPPARHSAVKPTAPAGPVAAAAGAVLSTYDAHLCLVCGSRYGRPYTDHPCGRLIPVRVTITALDGT